MGLLSVLIGLAVVDVATSFHRRARVRGSIKWDPLTLVVMEASCAHRSQRREYRSGIAAEKLYRHCKSIAFIPQNSYRSGRRSIAENTAIRGETTRLA